MKCFCKKIFFLPLDGGQLFQNSLLMRRKKHSPGNKADDVCAKNVKDVI